MQINAVYSITATGEPDVFLISCNITDDVPETYDCVFCSRPDDPFGLGPDFRQWLVDNPGFPIGPYVPPTIDEIRADAGRLARLAFRTKAKAAGLTTAAVAAYLGSIEDPDKQDDMQMYWDDAQYFARLDPFVVEAGAHAGLTPEQLDTVFYLGI